MSSSEFEWTDGLFSLCGLNCGLCPMQIRGECSGCFNGSTCYLTCPLAPCSVRHGNVQYLFYRLQDMHNNDINQLKMTKRTMLKNQDVSNPIEFMELQARYGSYGLMMPITFMRETIGTKRTTSGLWYIRGPGARGKT